MERTLISINLPNIVSIVIMAAVGFALVGLGSQLWGRMGMGAAPSGLGSF